MTGDRWAMTITAPAPRAAELARAYAAADVAPPAPRAPSAPVSMLLPTSRRRRP